MNNVAQVLGNHHLIFFSIMGVLIISLVIWQMPFFKQCLSDEKGGSGTRLSAFVLVLVIAFCEIFHTIKKQKFDTTHLLYILCAIGILFGVVKVAEIINLRNSCLHSGGKPQEPQQPAQKVETNVQVTTETN